jgi:rhodanese-related sulfurtransferase
MEGSSARQAARYIGLGYRNVKALKGGVTAWKEVGYPIKEDNA